ncbi:unnamed protein product [Rhizoctonia solani]|uniref:DUF6535 domain-containing protein n=1 Tax=Rhizoctonia solani TaxID=456999 RepID=A0A8H3CB96_9AGAM|nr:unnamed protein product [Rhizoctonia solani]
MLAKEWCLTFMSGRNGPPGAQARRRQQRWDGILGWRMKEVLMVLPSLIHLSLLLFAVGLCVFLWDVHFGVAIPVVFVTTAAVAAYVACTVLPFLDNYCPYGTVLSIMYKRFTELRVRTTHSMDSSIQDETTAKALHWMVENCETPRSVDVALQSLGGATKSLPQNLLIEWDMWTLNMRRLGSEYFYCENTSARSSKAAHARALQTITAIRDNQEGLDYGLNVAARRLEVLTLGLQSCIDQ